MEHASLAPTGQSALQTRSAGEHLRVSHSKDPDELIGNGIGGVIMGDGFLMVGVLLSATQSAVSSLLWLLLLIPAFFFFGKGFADVFQARQIRRRLKTIESVAAITDSPSPHASIAEVFNHQISGELVSRASVTERTTRQLK